MKNKPLLKRLCVSALGLFILATPAGGVLAANPSADKPGGSAKTGYEVDGRTSASVIAAKRAHSVAKQDEIGLAVYSAVFAIGLIVFFAQILNQRK